jgi:hypothetical protein
LNIIARGIRSHYLRTFYERPWWAQLSVVFAILFALWMLWVKIRH